MSFDEQISRINKAYEDKQLADTRASEAKLAQDLDKRKRHYTLSTKGPQFITAIHDLLATRARELSAKIEDPAHKLVVGYGPTGRFVQLASGGQLSRNVIRFPCAFVDLPDSMDALTCGIATSSDYLQAKPIDWRPSGDEIELVKSGQPQSSSDFVDELISSFLGTMR